MPDLGFDGSALTHTQLQVWIGQKLNPTSPLYNMAFALVFGAELRPDLFQQAWQRVVDGSEVLRTTAEERGGHASLRIRGADGFETTVLDFRGRPDGDRVFLRWCHERCSRPLSLSGPLVDSVLVQLDHGRTGWYLNQHHLITDAWSTLLLYRQVAAEYQALLDDGDRPPPLLPYYPTADALAQKVAARSAAVDHWDARLSPGERRTRFYGLPTAPVETASTRLTLVLGDERSRAVNRLCTEDGFLSLSENLSRFALFATLLVSWLHRISGQTDTSFDAPVAGRPTADAKRSLGLFMEMFPFSVNVEPHDTFRSLATKCLDEAQLLLCHALPGTSRPSSATASNVVLNYFPDAFGDFAGAPADVEWVHPGHGDTVHALRLQVHDFSGSGSYTLHFDFNEGALSDRLRRRSLEHFEQVLTALINDPDQAIAAVEVQTDDERQALAQLNATGSSPLPTLSVIGSFLDQAATTPDGVALRQGGHEMSFEQLRQATERLAGSLDRHGVSPGDRVAILSRRSTHVVVAILATLRTRAAYVPIDPSYPTGRVQHILRDSGARVLLLGEGLEPPASPPDVDITVLPIAEGLQDTHAANVTREAPRLDDLAYLIYTSGSTGRPKGVLIEHGGLADYLQWASGQYVRGDRLTFPLFTSLAFDLTVTSLFLPLITGGTLEIYPEPTGPVDSALMDVVGANAVDFIKLTPSHLSLLRAVDLTGSRIRRMVVGGEDLTTGQAASITGQFDDGLEIYNEYGPTEAVVGCVMHRYDPDHDTETSVPIGAPADHVEVEVLNDALSPVPAGVPGELWISRYGLARGYRGLDELTADHFRPIPARPGERRYRTGDLVRLASPHTLEFLGRRDRQLKISGFRVELAEIESVLASHPRIAQSAVTISRPVVGARVSPHDTCIRCGLPSDYPTAVFDEEGVCNVCRTHDSIKERASGYFKTMADLRELFDESARRNDSPYDCMMLLSGGKDSTYALGQLVEMGLSVYAFTLDNGFISDGAKDNMRRVTDQLGVPLELATTPAMNAIFRDSLTRFSNVCQGCFKTIYTLSTNRAKALGIPLIVTGLSRGQMFETRLSEEMFREGRYSPDDVDAAVLAARKVYHRVDDEVARSLDVQIFQDDRVFDEIQFVDFYRYCDAGLEQVLSYLDRKVPWVRPADTGRSTNCLINDVGIYIHRKERGFHNYALPYSWDVRLGHKTREAALHELDDQLDLQRIRTTLAEVGYDENRLSAEGTPSTLTAYYTTTGPVTDGELRRWLGDKLPSSLIPATLTELGAIPLTANGKLDEGSLPRPGSIDRDATHVPPEGPVEEHLAGSWQTQLGQTRIGASDNFFELGGTSLGAMEIMIRLCREFDIDLPLDTVFRHPVLSSLARVAEQRILDDVAELDAAGPGPRA